MSSHTTKLQSNTWLSAKVRAMTYSQGSTSVLGSFPNLTIAFSERRKHSAILSGFFPCDVQSLSVEHLKALMGKNLRIPANFNFNLEVIGLVPQGIQAYSSKHSFKVYCGSQYEYDVNAEKRLAASGYSNLPRMITGLNIKLSPYVYVGNVKQTLIYFVIRVFRNVYPSALTRAFRRPRKVIKVIAQANLEGSKFLAKTAVVNTASIDTLLRHFDKEGGSSFNDRQLQSFSKKLKAEKKRRKQELQLDMKSVISQSLVSVKDKFLRKFGKAGVKSYLKVGDELTFEKKPV